MKKTYSISEYDEWKFIEDNLPCYHQRDDVLHNDIVSRYVNGEDLSDKDAADMAFEFDSIEAAEKWLDNDIKRLFIESVATAFERGEIESITIVKKS